MNAFKGKQPLTDPVALLNRSRELARTVTPGPATTTLPVKTLVPNPDQPRRYFQEEALSELAESIQDKGVLQPLMVRPIGEGRYEIVFGERRYRAAQQAGLHEVPVIIREMTGTERDFLAAMENLQRENLSRFEEVDAKVRLIAIALELAPQDVPVRLKACRARPDENLEEIEKLEMLFQQLGREKWLSFVTNKLPVLNLPEPLLSSVRSGALDYTKAVLIARAPSKQHAELLQQAIEHHWTQEQVQEASRKFNPAPTSEAVQLKNIRQRITPGQLNKLTDDKRKKVDALLKQLAQLLT